MSLMNQQSYLDPTDLFRTLTSIQASEGLEGFQRTLVADPQAIHRSNFLALTNDLDFYESVRKLIADEAYWRIEEQHYKDVLQLVRDYNSLKQGKAISLKDCICPPSSLLRSLWRDRFFRPRVPAHSPRKSSTPSS